MHDGIGNFQSFTVPIPFQVRVGEVGGNTLGLYGGIFAPWGDLILAHGYQGAFHLWKKEDSSETDLELWRPLPTVSGHFGPVQDLSWEPTAGRFLVSVSADQTSRLHAPWVHPDKGNVSQYILVISCAYLWTLVI